MIKRRIIYRGLGHKIAFSKWSLIVHYNTEEVTIVPIPKKAYNILKALGFPEES